MINDPNPDDVIVVDIANLYKKDYKKFEKNAREYTKKYAK